MDNKLSSVIEKVQKLLALSNSSNPNEAAAAAAKANQLIDQYRLSAEDFATGEFDPLTEDSDYIYQTGKVTPWKSILISVLTTHYGVAYFNDTAYPEGRKISRFKLVGRTSDIQIARYMFAWLTMECQRLADSQAKGLGRVFVASYCEGFVRGVAEQLKASRQEVQKEASSSAIVKLDERLKESEKFMYAGRKLRTTRTTSQRRQDPLAFNAGKQQGQNIHLGQSLGTSKPKLLGN
jgi:hypothetical protein